MARHTYLRLAVAAFLISLVTPCLSTAQECNSASSRLTNAPQQINIVITSVEFPTDDTLPEELRTQLRRKVEKQEFRVGVGTPDTDWLNELNEVVVRGVLANAGYFLAQTRTIPYLIRAETQQRFYAVRIEVESGLLYRLGELRFENVTVFPQDVLRRQVRLMPGEPFDVARVREAFESIARVYSTKGYIDVTVEPQMQVDDKKQQINLTLRVSEETQYRVGTVEISGLDDETKTRLVSRLAPGSVFDVSVLKRFIEENDRNVNLRRHTDDRTVDIVLDVRKTGCIENPGKS